MARIWNGTSGDDTLSGLPGEDWFYGGGGNDTYLLLEAIDKVFEVTTGPLGGYDTVYSTLARYTLPANVEAGWILLAGGAMTGNGLDNRIVAGPGANTIDGGAGSDTVDYGQAASGVVVRLALTGAQNTVGSGVDTLVSIQHLAGSNFADRLEGNAGANRIDGGTGNDTIDGFAGADTMSGGGGDDLYYVRDAGDRVIDGPGIDTVFSLVAAYTLPVGVDNARVLLPGAADLTGNAGSNVLFAGAGANRFDGAGGRDTVDYRHAGGAVTLRLDTTAAQATGGSGTDSVVNVENIVGSSFADRLGGNAAANTLSGRAGNDALDGRGGSDVLAGGPGADAFVLASAPEATNLDRIADFAPVDDTIRLENAVFARLTATGTLAADRFVSGIGNVVALDANDFVLYDRAGGRLFYDADANGPGAAVQIALLDDFSPLTATPLLSAQDIFVT